MSHGDSSDTINKLGAKKTREAIEAQAAEARSRKGAAARRWDSPPRKGQSKLPEIQLPGEGRRVDIFAKELLPLMAQAPLFNHHGITKLYQKPTRVDEPQLRVVTPMMFRGLIEQYAAPFMRSRRGAGNWKNFDKTISSDAAAATLVHPTWLGGLRALRAINEVPLPIRNSGGTLELLKPGYDEPSGILTTGALEYDSRPRPLKEATQRLDALLEEFCFADGDQARTKTVTLAMMLTLYCRHLFDEPWIQRPAFIFNANAEGAGKTTMAYLGLVPVLGDAPTGTVPTDEGEMRKLILATLLDARPVLFLDNITEHLASGSLESLITSPVITDRILGLSQTATVPNNLTVIITGNQATYSPSLRRRSMMVELFLKEARFEDHVFKKSLETEDIKANRPFILEALWTLVYWWQNSGGPIAPLAHGEFPSSKAWFNIVGPILHHAGYTPLKALPTSAKPLGGDRNFHQGSGVER